MNVWRLDISAFVVSINLMFLEERLGSLVSIL
jgi:hypothetical protein